MSTRQTTWVIIGLSICVVVLASAVGIVLLQKKTEKIIVRETDAYTSSYLNIMPWQKFSLFPRPINTFERKGLAVYHNGKAYTYMVIPGNKVGVLEPKK